MTPMPNILNDCKVAAQVENSIATDTPVAEVTRTISRPTTWNSILYASRGWAEQASKSEAISNRNKVQSCVCEKKP